MTSGQRLPASLTSLDAALAALLGGLEPSAVLELSLREALGCVVAELPPSKAFPPHDVAAVDGWPLRASDLVGASSYTPVPLTAPPVWVEAGDKMPSGYDCVIDADSVEEAGPVIEVLAEATPGQGVRRAGGHVPDGFVAASGSRFRPLDLLLARSAGLETMRVRRPRLRIVNVPASSGDLTTAHLIAESARAAGIEVVGAEAAARDATSIAKALDVTACDLLVTIGGSGVGRADAAVLALAERSEVLVHGIALQPGRTSAIGRIGRTPVIALSGAADHALAAWWTLALPVLDRLSGRRPRAIAILPFARKLASSVGIADVALVGRDDDRWLPLAIGDLPFKTLVSAEAWLVVPDSSEGFAAGTQVGAYLLNE
jgi:molybdopterin molybdotransferase